MLIDFHITQTSIILHVKLRHSSTGAGLLGLTNASPGLRIAASADSEQGPSAGTGAGFGAGYSADAGEIDTIATPGVYVAPAAGHCRIKEYDSVWHKGIYELQLENGRAAVTGSKSLTISLSGAANLAECDVLIPLRQVDPYSATTFGSVVLSGAGLDAVMIETGLNARQALSLIAAADNGVVTGQSTGSPVFKGAGVATTRITATVNTSTGDRTAVVLNPPI